MSLKKLQDRALQIQSLFAKREIADYGRNWTHKDIMLGLVGDTGDLAKLVLAKDGIRHIDNTDAKVAHELADIMWSVFVLADIYGVDLEKEFLTTMDKIEGKITQ